MRRIAWLVGIAMLGALLLPLCGCGGEGGAWRTPGGEFYKFPSKALPSPSETPGAVAAKIAFTRQPAGHDQICVMNADGTHPTKLTTLGGGEPAWWGPQ